MRINNFIYVFILILFLVGISCVSAENNDDVNYLSTDDSVDVISVDENNVLSDSATSTIVYNWTELGSAVSKDKNFETVYIGANIIPGEQIKIARNVTIIGSADTFIGGGNSTDPVSYSAIPIYSNENGLSITLKDIRFQNSRGNILMQFSGNGTYVLDNCSFVNVNATGSHQAVVYLNLGYMDILNCTFENCTTSYGAVSNYNERSVNNVHMTVRDTTFKKNHATTEPGCINNCGQLEVYDSTFEENSAVWWAGAIHTHYNAETTIVRSNFIHNAAKSSYNGGALYTYGTLTVIDSNFTGNRAPNGGAIAGMNYMSRASVSLKNCEFRNNTASGSGGAILFPGAQFVVEDSRFYDNVAGGSGGALSISAAVSNITNCEFRSNRAHNAQNNSKGGALNFASTDGSLVGCVFEDCSSDNGGSVYWANDDGVMSGCSFVNSHADNNGGAVYWAGDNGLVEKSSFEKCSADNYGGGIYFEGENCTLADSTFGINDALEGLNWYSVEPLKVINVTTLKIQTAISAPDVNIIYGNTANLTVTLMDENKTALAGENITVSFNNNIYNGSTDENGQVIIPIPSNLIPDVYIANISYNGTEKYDSSKTTAEVTINKISTALTAADVVTVYNSGVKLIAVLNDENGSVISGSKVKIVLGSLSKTLITDVDGQVSLSMDAVVPGNYTAEIEFAGDAIYGESSTSAKVTIDKLDSTLSSSDVVTVYNSGDKLVAVLMDENGDVIGGAQVKIVLGSLSKTLITDVDGQVSLSMDAVVPGNYTAEIEFAGDAIYGESSTSAKVTIDKLDSTLSSSDVVTVYNSGDKLVAVLMDENGDVIGGAQVKIVLGSLSKTLITDADGQVSLSMDAVVPGNYTAEIEFAGDEIYNPATAIAKVSISKLDSTLNANDIVTIYNNGDKLVATLEDGNGSAIGGMQVKISLGAITKTLITDANGQISLSTDGLLPDKYSAEIVFAGDEIYNHANTTAKVTIDKLNSTLTSSDVITVYNSGDKLVASLMDGNGSAISGAKVKILLDTISKTLITDANGQVSLTTSALLPGNYSAEIVFAGDEIYDYSSTNVNVVISKLNSILNATDVVTVYNGGKKLVAILNDAEGNAIGGAQITIELGDISNTLITDENGQVALSTDGLVPDIYTADIIFAGDEIYAESSTSADVTVLPLGSEIIAEVSAEYTVVEVVNDSAVFNLVLIDENGNCLSNKTIDIEFNGIIENFTTDDEGKIEYLISAEAGNYTLVITFAGDDCYTESNASAEITVVPVKTEIIAPESIEYTIDEVIIGNATFNLVLIDEYGNAVTNMPVNITFNGITEEVTTDENGVASYIINAAAGNYTIDMAFGADGYYEASNASSTVIIKDEQKKQSKIFLRNALYFVTQTKMVNVTLWDENNTPIAGKTVHITIGNSTWSGITNVNGTASIRVGIGYGNHNATVHFDGDDQYVASNRTGVVRVIKETPSVMVRGADTQFKADDNNKVVKVYLRDRYDKALPEGSKIVFKLNGKTYIGFTDINGVASIKININTVGTFNAQAMYGGNSAYNPVTRDVKIRIV